MKLPLNSDGASPDKIDPVALCLHAEASGLDVVLIRIDTKPRAILFRGSTPRGRAVARGLGTTHHTRTSFVFGPVQGWPGYWQLYWADIELPGDWRVTSFCLGFGRAVLDNILRHLSEVDNPNLSEVDNPIPRNGDVTIEAL